MVSQKHSNQPSAAKAVWQCSPSKDKSETNVGTAPFGANLEPNQEAEASVFLTEKELAARHKKSVKTIRNLRVLGGYVPFVKIGRHVRYRLQDVLLYERSSIRTSTSDDGGDNA